MANKTVEERETISNLERFYKSRENVFRDYIEVLSDANYDAIKLRKRS